MKRSQRVHDLQSMLVEQGHCVAPFHPLKGNALSDTSHGGCSAMANSSGYRSNTYESGVSFVAYMLAALALHQRNSLLATLRRLAELRVKARSSRQKRNCAEQLLSPLPERNAASFMLSTLPYTKGEAPDCRTEIQLEAQAMDVETYSALRPACFAQ